MRNFEIIYYHCEVILSSLINFTQYTASIELKIFTYWISVYPNCYWLEPLWYGAITYSGKAHNIREYQRIIKICPRIRSIREGSTFKIRRSIREASPWYVIHWHRPNQITIKCSECRKHLVIYAKEKLSHGNAMQKSLNNFQDLRRTVFFTI